MVKKLTSVLLSALFSVSLMPKTSVSAMDPPHEPVEKVGEAAESPSFTITPWKVEGRVDYDAVLEQFGVEPLTPALISRWESLMMRSGLSLIHI